MNAKAKEDWIFKDKGVYYVPGLNNGKHTPGVYFELRYGIVVDVSMGDRCPTVPVLSYGGTGIWLDKEGTIPKSNLFSAEQL